MNKNSGTYNYCTQCKIKHNCCCDFDKCIDNIIITNKEKEIIVNRVGENMERVFQQINDKSYNIVSDNSVCPFYKNGCTIYDIRPIDCRLFPYDIKEINNKYYLVKYELPCGSKNVNEFVDDIVSELITIIDTYTDKKNNEKLSGLSYNIINKINI